MRVLFVISADDRRQAEIVCVLSHASQSVVFQTPGVVPDPFHAAVFSTDGRTPEPDWSQVYAIRIPVHDKVSPDRLLGHLLRQAGAGEQKQLAKRFEAILQCPLFHLSGAQETQPVLNALARAWDGEVLELVAPVCPAWSHNPRGYTFSGLQEGSRGVTYDLFAPILSTLVAQLQQAQLPIRLHIQVADVEWFGVEKMPLMRGTSRETFMRQIQDQMRLIGQDLDARGLGATVQSFLQIMSEQDYLARSAACRARFMQSLSEPPPVNGPSPRMLLDRLINTEGGMYRQQTRTLFVGVGNPDVEDAALYDIGDYMAYASAMGTVAFAERNLLLLVQTDAFCAFYRPYPVLPWRGKKGF